MSDRSSVTFGIALLRFCNLSNSATCITMSFWPTADVNDAVRFVILLHKVGLQLFRLKFVVFLLMLLQN